MPWASLWAAMNAATATGPSPRSPEGHRALEHIALHPQLGVLPAQPGQLRALVLAHRPVAAVTSPPCDGDPVPERALVDAQLAGHLRDRLAGLAHQPDRAGLEVLIEPAVLPRHRCPPQRRDVSTLRGEAQGRAPEGRTPRCESDE